MHESEIYYRRCFNLINELYSLYISGYNKDNVIKYSNNRRNNLDSISFKESYCFLFSSLISLMGINKEEIEETGKNTDYLNFITLNNDKKVHNQYLSELSARRRIATGLDEWLAVTNNLDNNSSNMTYLKKVRNALLHSHFDTSELHFTKVWNNNKSMFEAYICDSNFFSFVISYFGNTARMGLKDKCFMYMAPKNADIKDYQSLLEVIDKLSIKEIKYSLNKNYNGYNSLEYQLQKICLANEELRQDKFKKLYNKFDNLGIDIRSIEEIFFDDNIKSIISIYILSNYGEEFYKYDWDKQRAIIITFCQYLFENHSILSNWILHFMHIIGSDKVVDSYIKDDDLVYFACIPSLLLIKAYHILYRLQNDNFVEIDYNLIDFNYNNHDYYLAAYKNGNVQTNFLTNFNQLDLVSKNIIVCDIMRDALAHGNLKTYFTLNNNGKLEHIIEFNDVYRGSSRVIQMTMDKFDKFLNSEAFLPKYALVKNNGNVLK